MYCTVTFRENVIRNTLSYGNKMHRTLGYLVVHCFCDNVTYVNNEVYTFGRHYRYWEVKLKMDYFLFRHRKTFKQNK